MIIICGHKWTQNQRKTLKISGKKCIFTNNRLKITGFETFISIGYLSAILIEPNASTRKLDVHYGACLPPTVVVACNLERANTFYTPLHYANYLKLEGIQWQIIQCHDIQMGRERDSCHHFPNENLQRK